MDKKNFLAANWFALDEDNLAKQQQTLTSKDAFQKALAPFYPKVDLTNNNELNKYFVPGWKGDSLTSKSVKAFTKALDKLHLDAKDTFFSKNELSRKLKIGIYNEFLSYAEYKSLNCTNLDHYTTFWSEITNKDSEHKTELDRFLNILSFRIATIYILKLRFIITVTKQTNSSILDKDLFNPNSFITRFFKHGSSFELKAKAFEQSIYSWYRPSEAIQNDIIQFKEICDDLNITEIVKTISIKAENILNSEVEYSHPLSHNSFGLFINNLLINFPKWIKFQNKNNQHSYKAANDGMEIISCKFAGDYLESLSLSHWLAQNANKNLKWNEILCPDFKTRDFLSGAYLKIINELQFLTFLSQIANIQGREAKSFVCSIINSHLYNRKNTEGIQRSLLDDNNLSHSTYDRIILNLSHIPKSNPQHYLYNQISAQKDFLKENGYLYVISSKKIFVSSQKSKIEALLKDFKIESLFSLNNLQGRGEIGSYIYIFSKKSEYQVMQNEKNACFNFRFHGELKSFQEFSNITKLSQDFFEQNYNDAPPLYQKTLNNFKLEFFQDAIVKGQLINSTSEDSTKITHPSFFNQLMTMCNPLDFFFDLQGISFNQDSTYQKNNNTLFDFSNSFTREVSDYVFIIDQRSSEYVNIEIIPTKSLEAKAYDYGHANCHYFYAYPKWSSLNIFVFKEYFSSQIGQQLINLTFHNEHKKVKANLLKLLIPKFLMESSVLPTHILSALSLLNIDLETLLKSHPAEIEKKYKEIANLLTTITKNYPSEILTLISNFKRTIQRAIEIVGSNSSKINFHNPVISNPLVLSKTYPIYPDNQDIYSSFNSEALSVIHSPLTKIKKQSKSENDTVSHYLELYHLDQVVLTLYSDETMINFLEFLFTNVLQMPISKIMQGVQVPRLTDLKSIINAYNSLQKTLVNLYATIGNDFNQLLNSSIFHGK